MAITIEQLLNLPDVRVLSSADNPQEISIQLEFAANYSICHQCGQPATELHAEGETLRLRHLPIFQRPVYLYLRTKRYRCLQCDDHPTTTQRGDWYDAVAHCTKAFAEFLLLALVNSTTRDVTRKHGVTYDCLRGLLERYIKATVDWQKIKRLRVLGLDEISRLKGHRDFLTIVSTQDAQGQPELLAVLPGREKATVVAFLRSMPERLRAQVEQVCTDLYEGFANAVKEVLPHCCVVADRFHVAKLYRAAVDELRQREMKELKQLLPPDEYALFKGALWWLRRPSDELTSEELQLLELLFECAPALGQAYKFRKKLDAIFETKQSKQAAADALRAWIKAVKASGLACFDKFIGTLEHWLDEITNYFISRLSSGWVEGFNNKIKVLKRRCYGLTNLASFFRRIWLDLHGFEAFAH